MSIKILIISHSLNRTGAPLALLQLIRSRPLNLDMEISLLGLRNNDLENDFKKYIDKIEIIVPNPSKNNFIDLMQRILAIPSIVKFIIKVKPNVILVNSAANSRALLIVKLLQKVFSYRIILYIHEFEEMFRYFKFLRKKTLLLADRALIVSYDQYDWLRKEIKYLKNVTLVPNAIDNKLIKEYIKYEPEENFLNFKNKYKFLITNIGMMNYRKGLDLFIKIITSLENQNQDLGFVIIGDFANMSEKKTFFKSLENYNLDRRVYITGFQNNIFKYLKYSDLTAITSRSETFSRVALESMAVGKPVVAFNIKGLKSTLPMGYPYLAKCFDIAEFSKYVLNIKNLNSEDLNILQNELIMHSSKFDIEIISKQFWNIFVEYMKDS